MLVAQGCQSGLLSYGSSMTPAVSAAQLAAQHHHPGVAAFLSETLLNSTLTALRISKPDRSKPAGECQGCWPWMRSPVVTHQVAVDADASSTALPMHVPTVPVKLALLPTTNRAGNSNPFESNFFEASCSAAQDVAVSRAV